VRGVLSCSGGWARFAVFLGGVGGGQFQAAERAIRGGGSAAGMAVGDAGRGTIDEVGVDSDRGCVMAGRHGHGQQKIVTGGSERRRATVMACAEWAFDGAWRAWTRCVVG
jgi:hypothetical protein